MLIIGIKMNSASFVCCQCPLFLTHLSLFYLINNDNSFQLFFESAQSFRVIPGLDNFFRGESENGLDIASSCSRLS